MPKNNTIHKAHQDEFHYENNLLQAICGHNNK